MRTAKEIADEYGAGDVALELEILRHMEHHMIRAAVGELEACAKIADAYNDPASEIAYGKDARAAASEIALAIRARKSANKPFTPKL